MVDLLCFFEVLGVDFLILSAVKTGLKIECFFKVAMVILDGSRNERGDRVGSKHVAFDPL